MHAGGGGSARGALFLHSCLNLCSLPPHPPPPPAFSSLRLSFPVSVCPVYPPCNPRRVQMYGPEEWISRGLTEDDGFLSNTSARTLCPEDSVWRPCRVVGVVAETVLDPSDITLFEVQVIESLFSLHIVQSY